MNNTTLEDDTNVILKDFFGYFTGAIIVIKMIPQIIRVFKTKSTKDISLFFLILGLVGTASAFTYGLLIDEWPIMVRSVVTCCQILIILIAKIYYDKQEDMRAKNVIPNQDGKEMEQLESKEVVPNQGSEEME